MKLKQILFYIITSFYTTSYNLCLSQIGTPVIFNHKKNDYKASVVNWDVKSSNKGEIYVANAGGLMEYDGNTWKNYPLPNRSIVRSVYYHNDIIYVGGQDEVGYFKRTNSYFQFFSLRDKIDPKDLPLEDIWDIIYKDGFIYFRSIDRLYVIKDSVTKVIYTGNPIYALTSTNDGVYFVDQKSGIYRIDGFTESIYISRDQLQNKLISNLSGIGNQLFFSTSDSEIYSSQEKNQFSHLENTAKDYLQENIILDIKHNGENYIIATRFGGVVVLDQNGTIKHILTKKNGLQNNAINKLALDKDGNVWTASSNGVDHILINDRKQLIYPDDDLQGSIYDIINHRGKMYFATSNGLYVQTSTNFSSENRKFKLIQGSAGQVWGLDVIDNTLFMGHNLGAFIIENDNAIKISPGIGAWKFVSAPDKIHMYVGTYYGVDLYKKENNKWNFQKSFKYPNESSRILVNGNGNNIWVSHPYRGIYRMIIDENFNLIRSDPYYGQKGLPSNKLNYIFDINGKLIVAAETGVYEFDMIKDQFIKSDWLSTIVPDNINIRNIQTDNDGNIWYITSQEVAKLTISEGKLAKKENFPELVGKFVGGFENLYLHDKENVIVCSDQGAILYNINTERKSNKLITKLQSIAVNDSIYKPINEKELNNKFTHLQNSITFNYSSNKARPDIAYNCYLEGNDKLWSGWALTSKKEYNNLLPGSYIFHVKSKLPDGSESDVYHYTFDISPPWYKSNMAYAIYSLFIVLFLTGMLMIPNKKYQRDKAILVDENQKTQEELEQLKIEKLQNEIDYQNSQLASSTMHLVQKNATLTKVKSDIEGIRNNISDIETRNQLKKVLSSLKDDIRLDEDWEGFAIHFDKVHSDFLQRLKENHPNLTAKDLKLAAYLRMNLSTKEIAPLLNISVRGVEISRYRLRKKIKLSTETNLNEWMLSF